MKNPSYKSEHIERKYLKQYGKEPIFKGKSSLLELIKDFMELRDRIKR